MPTSPPDEPHGLPAPANPFGIKLLRFFLWLLPAGLAVGWFFLELWLQTKFYGPYMPTGYSARNEALEFVVWLCGLASWIATGWFDAQLALPCRLGRRPKSSHVVFFVLVQLLVAPACLIATVFAICLINPPAF